MKKKSSKNINFVQHWLGLEYKSHDHKEKLFKLSLDQNLSTIIDLIGTNVFFDKICFEFLYPNEIYKVITVSKTIYQLAKSHNIHSNNFLQKMNSLPNIKKYWISVLDTISLFVKHIDESDSYMYSLERNAQDKFWLALHTFVNFIFEKYICNPDNIRMRQQIHQTYSYICDLLKYDDRYQSQLQHKFSNTDNSNYNINGVGYFNRSTVYNQLPVKQNVAKEIKSFEVLHYRMYGLTFGYYQIVTDTNAFMLKNDKHCGTIGKMWISFDNTEKSLFREDIDCYNYAYVNSYQSRLLQLQPITVVRNVLSLVRSFIYLWLKNK